MPGVEASTGALGHGLSIGVGMALAARMTGRDSRVYRGDGRRRDQRRLGLGGRRLRRQAPPVQPHRDHRLQQDPVGRQRPRSRTWSRWPTSGAPSVSRVRGRRPRRRRAAAGLPRCRRLRRDRPRAVICHTVKGKGIPVCRERSRLAPQVQAQAGRTADRSAARSEAEREAERCASVPQHGPRPGAPRRARRVHRLRSRRRTCSAR